MPRKDNYRWAQMFCVVCQDPIPEERKWDAITCSPECTKRRKDYGRSRKDQTKCRYCSRPSTPDERARYSAWRRWEKAGKKDPQSAASLLRQVQRLQQKIAELDLLPSICPTCGVSITVCGHTEEDVRVMKI